MNLNDEAKEYIAENGFDPIYGASPLKRFIQRSLETKLARAIIAGDVRENQEVNIIVEQNELCLKVK